MISVLIIGLLQVIKYYKPIHTTLFSYNTLNVNSLECVSMNNQESMQNKIRNKCRGTCNTINYSNAKPCVSDTTKSINVKVVNLT